MRSRSGPMPSIGEIAPWRTWYWPLNSPVRSRARTSSGSSTTHSRRLVAARVAADRTERLVADVEAPIAEDDLVADVDQRRGQGARLGIGRAQQVEGQALRGLGPDPGQARERFDEPGDGSMTGLTTRAVPTSPAAEPAGDRAHLLLGELARCAQGVVDRGDDEVLEHLDVVRIDGRRVDGHADQFLLAGDRGLDHAAAGRTVDDRASPARSGCAASPAASAAPSAGGWPSPSVVSSRS